MLEVRCLLLLELCVDDHVTIQVDVGHPKPHHQQTTTPPHSPVCQLQKMIGARTLAVARRLYAAQARTSSGRAVARAVGASQQQQQQWRTRRAGAGEGSCHRPHYCIVLQLLTQAATVACVVCQAAVVHLVPSRQVRTEVALLSMSSWRKSHRG